MEMHRARWTCRTRHRSWGEEEISSRIRNHFMWPCQEQGQRLQTRFPKHPLNAPLLRCCSSHEPPSFAKRYTRGMRNSEAAAWRERQPFAQTNLRRVHKTLRLLLLGDYREQYSRASRNAGNFDSLHSLLVKLKLVRELYRCEKVDG